MSYLPLISQAVLAAGLLLCALKYPPFVLCIYLLFSSAESYGTSLAVTPGYLDVMLAPIFFTAGASALAALWRARNTSPAASRLFAVASLAAVATIWLGISVFANGGTLRQTVDNMCNRGPYPVIFGLAYWSDRGARLLLLVTVAIQIALALLSLIAPDSWIAVFQAARYNPYAIDSAVLGQRFERVSAQFLSSIQLAFYSGVGVIAAVYIWITSRMNVYRLLGVALAVAALAVSYQTASRGVWGGVVLGLTLAVWQQPRSGVPVGVVAVALAALLYVAPAIIPFLQYSENQDFFRERYSATGLDWYREAALREMPLSLLRSPVGGLGAVDVEDLLLPHVLPLDHAILYGWVSGICLTLILFRAIQGVLTRPSRRSCGMPDVKARKGVREVTDHQLAMMLGVVALCVAFSNGSAARALEYVCLGVACTLWASRGSGRARAAHTTRLTA